MNDAQLSQRRRDVLTGAASGLSNAQISYRLSLSEKTIKNHMSAGLMHYGVSSRTGAVVKAIQNGHLDVASIAVSR